MRRKAMLGAVVVMCSMGMYAVSCSKQEFFESSDLGVEIDDFDWSTAKHTTEADGDELYDEDGDVYIDGMGDHWVDVDDEQPHDIGGRQKLTVIDREDGNKRIYSFDPATNSLTFSDGETSLEVVQNPDKSYTVDGVPAADGKAALALLKESPVYRDASSWGFIMTYSVCQSCLARNSARTPVNCNIDGTANTADSPAVCDVFRDLCDCAACDKANKHPCSRCP